FLHATANLYLEDADAARLERCVLDTVEGACAAHGGRTVPAEVAQYCQTFQDPALMRESRAVALAHAYLAHRLLGVGMAPTDQTAVAQRRGGVAVYTHGGLLLPRPAHGQPSLSWRNRPMAPPATSAGMQLIGPQSGTMLATLQVAGR